MGEGKVPSSRELIPGRGVIYPQGLLAGQDIELQQQEERVRILDKEVRGACMTQRARVCVCEMVPQHGWGTHWPFLSPTCQGLGGKEPEALRGASILGLHHLLPSYLLQFQCRQH